MAYTFNPEISEIITSEGAKVIYSAGNIIIASEVSEELIIELFQNPKIEDIEMLPLKEYSTTQPVNPNTYTSEVVETSESTDPLDVDDPVDPLNPIEPTDTGNVSGGSSNSAGA
jgi:hypothetical protein